MNPRLFYIIIVLLSLTQFVHAIDPAFHDSTSYTRFSIRAGLSNTLMKDQYISSEKYSGSYPFATFGLSQKWAGRVNELVLSHGNTETLSNENIASWYEFTLLKVNLLYPLNKKSHNSNGSVIYLGPNLSYYDYFFSHTFAMLSRYESEGSILSLGISSKLLYSIHSKFQVEFALSSNVFSIAKKKFDNQKYPNFEGDSMLTTLLTTGYFNLEGGVRLAVIKKLNLFIGYDLMFVRIGEWDKYSSLNNLFFLEFSYDL